MKGHKHFILITVLFLTGCAMFDTYKSKAAEDIALGIRHYCLDTTEDMRQAFRTEVNDLSAPNTIVIT